MAEFYREQAYVYENVQNCQQEYSEKLPEIFFCLPPKVAYSKTDENISAKLRKGNHSFNGPV